MALTADNFWLHFLRFEILLRLIFCLKSFKNDLTLAGLSLVAFLCNFYFHNNKKKVTSSVLIHLFLVKVNVVWLHPHLSELDQTRFHPPSCGPHYRIVSSLKEWQRCHRDQGGWSTEKLDHTFIFKLGAYFLCELTEKQYLLFFVWGLPYLLALMFLIKKKLNYKELQLKSR